MIVSVNKTKKMDKYIFLDIDGVLATGKKVVDGQWAIEAEQVDKLGEIVVKTNAKIVLSSSWRLSTLEATKKKMKDADFYLYDHIVGITERAYNLVPRGTHLPVGRGTEIKMWIDNNVHRKDGQGRFDFKNLGKDYTYVILDNSVDMLYTQAPYFIKCNPKQGLTWFDTVIAIGILNGRAPEFVKVDFPTYNAQ